MKVRELIALLSKMDQEAVVITWDCYNDEPTEYAGPPTDDGKGKVDL